jgi:capsid protein
MGRRKAFVVSAKHGQSTVKLTEATIVPATSFKLIKAVFRLNQIRGVSELLPILNDALDLYELRASELQSAKLASKYAGAITKQNALEASILRSGVDAEGLLDAPVAAGAQNTYEAFEQLSGGFFEYLEPGEKVEFFNSNRPNNGLKDFFSFVLTGAGASWGIAKTYTSLDCEKSYFAARGDMLLTWATFYVEQKFMERHFFDWIGARAIAFAAKSKGWKLDEGWQSKMSWIFPTMPLLDELKAANTNAANLDNLLTDFSELLGPDWQDKLRQRSEQDKFLKGIGLSRVHAVTGGTNIDTKKETEKDTTTDTGDSKNEQ